MKRIISLFAIVFALVMSQTAFAQKAAKSADGNKLMKDAQSMFKPIPVNVKDGYKMLKNNTASEAKYKLGKMLYFEPRLSKSGVISCNTCHNLGMGGVDGQPKSKGHGWQRGGRNAPTVLNSVYNDEQFWDGRAADLKAQATGPMENPVEMAATPEHVTGVLNSMPEYVKMFAKAFPNDKAPISVENAAKAIEVFEATLLTPNSRFDKFIRGDAKALNKKEKAGLQAFMNKGCGMCHSGINFTSPGYHPFGLVEKPSTDIMGQDEGRYVISKAKSDNFAFKAPTLRNIAYTAPYFHSGKVWSLEQAVAIMGSAQLGIKLSKEEVSDITSFLKTLTGNQQKMIYPILPASTDKTPKPVDTVDAK